MAELQLERPRTPTKRTTRPSQPLQTKNQSSDMIADIMATLYAPPQRPPPLPAQDMRLTTPADVDRNREREWEHSERGSIAPVSAPSTAYTTQVPWLWKDPALANGMKGDGSTSRKGSLFERILHPFGGRKGSDLIIEHPPWTGDGNTQSKQQENEAVQQHVETTARPPLAAPPPHTRDHQHEPIPYNPYPYSPTTTTTAASMYANFPARTTSTSRLASTLRATLQRPRKSQYQHKSNTSSKLASDHSLSSMESDHSVTPTPSRMGSKWNLFKHVSSGRLSLRGSKRAGGRRGSEGRQTRSQDSLHHSQKEESRMKPHGSAELFHPAVGWYEDERVGSSTGGGVVRLNSSGTMLGNGFYDDSAVIKAGPGRELMVSNVYDAPGIVLGPAPPPRRRSVGVVKMPVPGVWVGEREEDILDSIQSVEPSTDINMDKGKAVLRMPESEFIHSTTDTREAVKDISSSQESEVGQDVSTTICKDDTSAVQTEPANSKVEEEPVVPACPEPTSLPPVVETPAFGTLKMPEPDVPLQSLAPVSSSVVSPLPAPATAILAMPTPSHRPVNPFNVPPLSIPRPFSSGMPNPPQPPSLLQEINFLKSQLAALTAPQAKVEAASSPVGPSSAVSTTAVKDLPYTPNVPLSQSMPLTPLTPFITTSPLTPASSAASQHATHYISATDARLLQTSLSALAHSNQTLQSRLSNLEQRYGDLITTHDVTVAEKREAEETVTDLRKDVELHRLREHEWEGEVIRIRDQYAEFQVEYQAHLRTSDSLHSEIENLRSELETLRSAHEQLKSENAEQIQVMEEQRSELETLRSTHEQLKSENAEQIQVMEEQTKRMETLQRGIAERDAIASESCKRMETMEKRMQQLVKVFASAAMGHGKSGGRGDGATRPGGDGGGGGEEDVGHRYVSPDAQSGYEGNMQLRKHSVEVLPNKDKIIGVDARNGHSLGSFPASTTKLASTTHLGSTSPYLLSRPKFASPHPYDRPLPSPSQISLPGVFYSFADLPPGVLLPPLPQSSSPSQAPHLASAFSQIAPTVEPSYGNDSSLSLPASPVQPRVPVRIDSDGFGSPLSSRPSGGPPSPIDRRTSPEMDTRPVDTMASVMGATYGSYHSRSVKALASMFDE
ncbi:hypothetical protein DFS34DRAFT_647008 [Phlyctochytrium arcticum]|nr:hypothetical protein DFS34DRAFT_647008 [Phlyctochytrium arcticum]